MDNHSKQYEIVLEVCYLIVKQLKQESQRICSLASSLQATEKTTTEGEHTQLFVHKQHIIETLNRLCLQQKR